MFGIKELALLSSALIFSDTQATCAQDTSVNLNHESTETRQIAAREGFFEIDDELSMFHFRVENSEVLLSKHGLMWLEKESFIENTKNDADSLSSKYNSLLRRYLSNISSTAFNSVENNLDTMRASAINYLIEESYQEKIKVYQYLPYHKSLVEQNYMNYKNLRGNSFLYNKDILNKYADDLKIDESCIQLKVLNYLSENNHKNGIDDQELSTLEQMLVSKINPQESKFIKEYSFLGDFKHEIRLILTSDLGEQETRRKTYNYKTGAVYEIWKGKIKVYESRSLSDTETQVTSFDETTGVISKRAFWQRTADANSCTKLELYYENGNKKLVESAKDASVHFYNLSGRRVAAIDHAKNSPELSYRWIFTENGNTVSTFDVEKMRNPNLTLDSYLNLLATKLETKEDLYSFFKYVIQYKDDNLDHWQSPHETVGRIEKSVMLGDCEDFAFLAQELLRRKGIKAFVIYLPGHAECIWLEQDSQNKYQAFSLGSFGLDCNGECYSYESPNYSKNAYANPKEAVQSLMKKYELGGLGLKQGMKFKIDGDIIDIISIDNPAHTATTILISSLAQK